MLRALSYAMFAYISARTELTRNRLTETVRQYLLYNPFDYLRMQTPITLLFICFLRFVCVSTF